VHDRNRNAAQNILVRGLLEIEKENSSSGEARAYEADVNKDSGEKLSVAGPGIRPLVAGITVSSGP
jgi:transposase